jgi:glycosyltransferase involved in cell wall biosynthesis
LVLVGQLWRGRQFGISPNDSKSIEELKSRPNVHWLGHKPPVELPRYLFAFDVGLVAYKDTPFDRARDPLKLYQYLAAGKPVVSTPLTAFDKTPRGVYIANNGQEFCTKVRTALAEAETGLEERIRFGRASDWSERGKLTEQVLEQTFPGWCRKHTVTAEAQSATGSN